MSFFIFAHIGFAYEISASGSENVSRNSYWSVSGILERIFFGVSEGADPDMGPSASASIQTLDREPQSVLGALWSVGLLTKELFLMTIGFVGDMLRVVIEMIRTIQGVV